MRPQLVELSFVDPLYTNIIFMPNGNYSIDIQVYGIELSFFTDEVLVSGICGGECADVVMGRTIHAVCHRQ